MSGTLAAIKEVFKGSDSAMIAVYCSGIMTKEDFINTVGTETVSEKKEA